ncbi:hypothetical protein DJ564_18685 [Pseudomonas sp. 31-12]|nr:hypothetical protein DJ564_18685 [Pseudomonas sp. 31-12]
MDVNDYAFGLNERGVWTSIASRLAPTGFFGGHDMVFTTDDLDAHQVGYQSASFWFLICPVGRPSAGSAQWAPRPGCRGSRPRPWMADGGGPTEQDRSEAPYVRGESVWLLCAFQSHPP